jgi:hypothetical protein
MAFDKVLLVDDMMAAITRLVQSNHISNIENNESMLEGKKNTQPIDALCFRQLGIAADNLLLLSRQLHDKNITSKAAVFKQIFFKFSIYRLSGGLDSSLTDDMTHKLLLDSFNIHVKKFSA